jgi:hypothetical protein
MGNATADTIKRTQQVDADIAKMNAAVARKKRRVASKAIKKQMAEEVQKT